MIFVIIDKTKSQLVVKGGVPGAVGGLLVITKLGRIKGYTPPPEEKPEEEEQEAEAKTDTQPVPEKEGESSFAKATEDKGRKVKTMLEMVEMSGFANKLARDLSFGQKRLVELARTILNSHKLLMLDEPVGGVNPKLRKEIAKILLNLKAQGETILLIEHDMNFTLNIADKVIVMDEGKVIAEGKPEQIKTNPRVLEAYLGE